MTPEQHNQLALEVAIATTEGLPPLSPDLAVGKKFLIEFARRYRAALLEKMEPIPMDRETYTLQLKEAWESGFRCGLREARPEEV